MSLRPYKVLVFDCYGTLIDWESGMLDNLQALLSQPGCPSSEQLFSVLGPHETRIQTETPTMLYPEVLRQTYLATAAEFKLKGDDESAISFGNSIGGWKAFEDSAEALKKLHDLGLKLVILSNVNITSFDKSRKKLEEGYSFDGVYLAEIIGSYKPSLKNFDYAIEHIKQDFGFDPEDILFVANSKLHDIVPAHKKGRKAVWIDRPSAVMGVKAYTDVEPDWTFTSMAEFASAIASE